MSKKKLLLGRETTERWMKLSGQKQLSESYMNQFVSEMEEEDEELSDEGLEDAPVDDMGPGLEAGGETPPEGLEGEVGAEGPPDLGMDAGMGGDVELELPEDTAQTIIELGKQLEQAMGGAGDDLEGEILDDEALQEHDIQGAPGNVKNEGCKSGSKHHRLKEEEDLAEDVADTLSESVMHTLKKGQKRKKLLESLDVDRLVKNISQRIASEFNQ